MLDIPKTDLKWDGPKGSWFLVNRENGKGAMFNCPKCGQYAGIDAPNHTIADDGAVHPSVVCPYDNCDFHDYIRLIGW